MKNLFLLLFFVSSHVAFAWGTALTWDTHKDITKDVIHNKLTNDMTEEEYPDIIRFEEKLKDGSGTESHILPGDVNKWAPTPALWYTSSADDCAIKKYNNSDFVAAYYDIGLELHLIQDLGSPAHEKVCYHGGIFYWVDDMEGWAHLSHDYSTINTPLTFDITYEEDEEDRIAIFHYYLGDNEDDDDEDDHEFNGVSDPNDDPDDDASNAQDGPNAFDTSTTWGTYGMPDYYNQLSPIELKEKWPGKNEGVDYFFNKTGNSVIMYRALRKSYDDTLITLKDRSSHLPPIIPDNINDSVSITPSLFGPQMATTISFSVMENRKKTVRIRIKASVPIKDIDGVRWDALEDASYYDLDPCVSADQLPFYSMIDITWKGDLKYNKISDGQHTVTIQVLDADDNWSEIRSRPVKYDATPPTGTITFEGI